MRFRPLIIVLLLAALLASASAQDSKFFREKLGQPSELYRHQSGISVLVDYDNKGQVCSLDISDPAYQGGSAGPSSFHRLVVVADELISPSMRGAFRGRTGELGNCIKVEYKDYERVFIEMNENACYKQWVRIYFKRNSCPKPPQVRGLYPMPE